MENFKNIIQLVCNKSPLQKKKIEKYLSRQDEFFYISAEKFAKDYSSYLESQNIPFEYAVDAYLKMCNDMMKSQVFFMKTGKYPIEDATKALEVVYNDEKEMKSYMIGLAISQFLWSTHYVMYQFLLENIRKRKGKIKNYLEIGPGHGLFLKDANLILGENVEFTVLDISKTSIDISKSILDYLVKNNKIKYLTMNIHDFNTDEKFDFITMGEVLEHVNLPNELLLQFSNLLSNNGSGFISTCVNCPTLDHVCHFKSINEIREILIKNKLAIEVELILPVEEMPMEEIIEKKITINYCAIVKINK